VAGLIGAMARQLFRAARAITGSRAVTQPWV
jgi:hypothetical protein